MLNTEWKKVPVAGCQHADILHEEVTEDRLTNELMKQKVPFFLVEEVKIKSGTFTFPVVTVY